MEKSLKKKLTVTRTGTRDLRLRLGTGSNLRNRFSQVLQTNFKNDSIFYYY